MDPLRRLTFYTAPVSVIVLLPLALYYEWTAFQVLRFNRSVSSIDTFYTPYQYTTGTPLTTYGSSGPPVGDHFRHLSPTPPPTALAYASASAQFHYL